MEINNSVGLAPVVTGSYNGNSVDLSRTIAATPIAATPPPFLPDMSAALIPHSAPVLNAGHHHMGFVGGMDSMKKKRGRPRKYAPDGSVAVKAKPVPPPVFSPMSNLHKRRGRPPGTGKKQKLAALGREVISGSSGGGAACFTPHAITVSAGEDVAARIMSFSQQGPRGICIMSANGAISNVTLRQPASAGGTVTYEGRFEILALSGSFLVTESGGTRSRNGGLSVSLAGPDGRVVGGGVAGMLIAASPVQVVVGSFICSSGKAHHKSKLRGKKSSGSNAARVDGDLGADPSMNDIADLKPDSSPLNQSSGNEDSSNDESNQGQMIAVQSMAWAGSQDGRRNIDIDMSIPGQ